MLNLQNLETVKSKLDKCDVTTFKDVGTSFQKFINKIEISKFRHIENLEIDFTHPVTILSGTNKVGKTSILLLIACSHENFRKLDSTTPETTLKIHSWNGVLRFTKYEREDQNYAYKMNWREGVNKKTGEGKRNAGQKASWTGLGKKSQENRENAKIKKWEVRLIDLERILPLRNFSGSLLRKSNSAKQTRLNEDVEKAFAYIFDMDSVKLYEVGSHVNKRCYLVETASSSYSSYGAASGEEAVINILKDIIEPENGTLILIDEMEAGFHPYIQRRLANIIQYISWNNKKQFIITTHSPTLLSAFPQESRRFIERSKEGYRTIPKISKSAAFSKMDSHAYPLINLYCEDNLAKFLVTEIIIRIGEGYSAFHKLINIIPSGPIAEVKNDYLRHKNNYKHMRHKIGYCCVFDGDFKNDPKYSLNHENTSDHTFFLFPYEAPEKFLIKAYLTQSPHQQLSSALAHNDHHGLFIKMVELGLAADENDARNKCFNAFQQTLDYEMLEFSLSNFLIRTVTHFSEQED